MLNKNDYCQVKITDIGHKGEGIGRYNDFVIFADNCLPGDVCRIKILKVKKSYAYGKVEKILEPSALRVEAPCAVAEKGGGCSLMHMDYSEQINFKEKKVFDALTRIGGLENPNILPIEAMENTSACRNKAQIPVREESGKLLIGYYAKNSHRIVENDDCYIQDKAVKEVIEAVKSYMIENSVSAYNEEKRTGMIRHIIVKSGFATGQIMVCIVLNAKNKHLPKNYESLIENLTDIDGMTSISFNYNSKDTNVIMGENNRFIWGNEYIEDMLGGFKFKISPHSFYQVNPVQAVKMYECALDFAQVSGEDTVIDAYCGTGTISMFFAKKAKKVYGLELVPQAVEDAVKNAEENCIENAEFLLGKAEDIMTDFAEKGIKADIIIADPPRKGCEPEFLHAIGKIAPDKFVYISCNPDTLARDIAIMKEYGYCLDKAKPFDMFCYSTHVECVVLLSRKDG